MRELGGIRASRPVARRLACAVCLAGLITPGVVAQDRGEVGGDHIRVLKGARWFDQRSPFATDSLPPTGVVGLKGTRWDAPPAQAAKETAVSADGGLAADAVFPLLRFPAADTAPRTNPWADFLPDLSHSQANKAQAEPASHVTVVVVPTILPLPSPERPAGGNEASETHLPIHEKEPAAAAIMPSAASSVPVQSQPEALPQPVPASSGYSAPLVQFASTAGGVLVALLLFCAGLVALRRLGVSVQFGQPSRPGEASLPPGLEPAPEAIVWEETASTFDLGPTYEEELRQKEQAAREQEQAVLRQLFEQNVRLREQIGELEEQV